jgi:hypothetical protein
MKLFREVCLVFLGAFIGKILGDTLWENTVEHLGVCDIGNKVCSTNAYWVCFFIFILVIIVVSSINVIVLRNREKKRVRFEKNKHDNALVSIKVFNDGNEKIKDCWAKYLSENYVEKDL